MGKIKDVFSFLYIRAIKRREMVQHQVTRQLLNWYDENKRDLPWRGTTDPYMIWVSEIILQQTRVAQGWDYFVRFTRRFPNVETLANASERRSSGLARFRLLLKARNLRGSEGYHESL